jgi:3-oxoacyl-[acyl-carrier protein] reductase
MDLGLAGKVALVTGASRGIDRAAALAFAREGARVAICGRDEASLKDASDELRAIHGCDVLAVSCDLSQVDSIERLVSQVSSTCGTIHALVNNSGGPPPGTYPDLSNTDWHRAFDQTLMSTVRTTHAVLPLMRTQRWGRIVNITSYAVKHPIPDLMLSNRLRLGVLSWAKTRASQVACENVSINTVGPGWTRTDRVTQMLASRAGSGSAATSAIEEQILRSVPMGRFGTVHEIGDVVVFLASARASFVSGTFLAVDGGATQNPV